MSELIWFFINLLLIISLIIQISVNMAMGGLLTDVLDTKGSFKRNLACLAGYFLGLSLNFNFACEVILIKRHGSTYTYAAITLAMGLFLVTVKCYALRAVFQAWLRKPVPTT